MEKRFEWQETGGRGVGGKLFPVQARHDEGWIRGWQWRHRTVDKCERYCRIETTGIGKELNVRSKICSLEVLWLNDMRRKQQTAWVPESSKRSVCVCVRERERERWGREREVDWWLVRKHHWPLECSSYEVRPGQPYIPGQYTGSPANVDLKVYNPQLLETRFLTSEHLLP